MHIYYWKRKIATRIVVHVLSLFDIDYKNIIYARGKLNHIIITHVLAKSHYSDVTWALIMVSQITGKHESAPNA